MAIFKQDPDELQAVLARALSEQSNEELALVKAQLAVANDKVAQLERQVARLKADLAASKTATEFVAAFQAIVQPLIPEPVAPARSMTPLLDAIVTNGSNGKHEAARP